MRCLNQTHGPGLLYSLSVGGGHLRLNAVGQRLNWRPSAGRRIGAANNCAVCDCPPQVVPRQCLQVESSEPPPACPLAAAEALRRRRLPASSADGRATRVDLTARGQGGPRALGGLRPGVSPPPDPLRVLPLPALARPPPSRKCQSRTASGPFQVLQPVPSQSARHTCWARSRNRLLSSESAPLFSLRSLVLFALLALLGHRRPLPRPVALPYQV